MNWLNKFLNRFRAQPKYEKAAIRLEKLEKWVELQFKSVLDPVKKQVGTNFESLQLMVEELDAASLSLSQAILSEAKVHIHQLTIDHRKLLINSMHAISSGVKSSPTDIVGVKDLYEALPKHLATCDDILNRGQKSLFELLPSQATKCQHILNRIKINVRQANDIFEDTDYQMYLSIQRGVYNIHKKMEEVLRIKEVVAKRQENIKALSIEANRLKMKISDIKHDSRYKHEQIAVKNPATRYRNSFYDLDLQDLGSKLDLVEQKIEANQRDLAAREASIKALNIDSEKHNIFSKLKKRLGIEIELVE